MRQLAEVDVIIILVIIYFYYNKFKYCLIVKTVPFIVVTIAIVIMGSGTQYGAARYSMIHVIKIQYGAAPYSMIQVIKIQYGAAPYSMTQVIKIQYSEAEQCSMAQQI